MRKKENINQRIQYAGSIIHSVQNRIRRHKISNDSMCVQYNVRTYML